VKWIVAIGLVLHGVEREISGERFHERTRGTQDMKHNVVLTITSLLSALLMMLHVADDIVRGMDSWGLQNLFGVVIWAVWMYAALFLAERRSGYILLLVVSILGVGITGLHMSGGRGIAKSSGGFFFIWTLYMLGVTALLSAFLSARGLWSLRRGRS
jgi:hypothetical protein